MTRQAYYRRRTTRQRAVRDGDAIAEMVRQERKKQPRIGGRKLQHRIRAAGVVVGRDSLFDILRERGMLVPRRRKRVCTTYFDRSLPVYRNLLYNLEPTQPNQVWVADITYIETDEDYVYLSLITDLHSRRIVGWNAGASLTALETLKALENALRELPADRWPIHHSDRGCQYCCHEYVAVLQARGLSISMTEQNHCYENCYAERVNGILKDEFNLQAKFRTKAQAYRAIKEAIKTYNELRPHTSLGMRTPNQVHQLAA